MQLGNRRFAVVVALGAIVAGLLSGCSALSLSGSASVSDANAVALGKQALTFSGSTPSPQQSQDPSTGSGLSADCPASLKQGLLAGLSSNDVLTTLNPKVTLGVSSAPQLTQGFTPSCAFGISVNGSTVDELYFLGISDADEATIASRVVSAGFVAGTISNITNGTQQIYTKGSVRVVLGRLTIENVQVLLVAG